MVSLPRVPVRVSPRSVPRMLLACALLGTNARETAIASGRRALVGGIIGTSGRRFLDRGDAWASSG